MKNPTNSQAKKGQTTRQSRTSSQSKVRYVTVDAQHVGQRLDNFLITHLKGVPKTMVYRIIRKGEVRVNKGRAKQTTRLALNDQIRIPPLRQTRQIELKIKPSQYEFLNQAIIFEDDTLLVLNKPAGMAVHAGSGVRIGVIEALRGLRGDIEYLELVHRLDRQTSGCLLLAKKAAALKCLNKDFSTNSLKNARVNKQYLSLLAGRWQFGQRRINKKLDNNARQHGERHVVVSENGRYASSIFTPIAIGANATLIKIKLLTGRTHQVRVHAASENHPVAGDKRYGDAVFNQHMHQLGLRRLFLHASQLSIYHPSTEQKLSFESALPDELQSVAEQLQLENV